MKFDLHMHSHYSDGRFSPAELLQKCRDRGLEVVSLTDHETVLGAAEAAEAAQKLGIRVIPGLEFTSVFQGDECHILGYFVHDNPALKRFLDTWKETKLAQIQEIISNLQKFGYELSLEDVLARVKGSLDRFHIALAVFPNSDKSAEEAEKRKAFFRKYLLEKSSGGEGLAFAKRQKPDAQSVIGTIRESGGLSFLAHPFWRTKDRSVIAQKASNLKELGLSGIEICYPSHNEEQVRFLHEIAQDLSLFESGGSDFHREDGFSDRQLAKFETFGMEINFPFGEVKRETY